MTFGTRPGTRRFAVNFKDAIKLGYNDAVNTEIAFPAQDYRMVSDFTYTCEFLGSMVQYVGSAISKASTQYPANPSDAVWEIPSVLSTTQVFTKPFMMDHYVLNPTNSVVCLDVEVYCWRKGFGPNSGATLSQLYFDGHGLTSESTVTSFLQGDKNDPNITLNVAPQLHGVAIGIASTKINNARKTVEQLFHTKRVRMGALKLLSKRRCVAIPPGGIYHFKVKMRYPSGFPTDYFTTGVTNAGKFFGNQRLVILKWNTQMGTVTGTKEQSHLSEKVHLVLARRFCFRGYMEQRVPDVRAQYVVNHDGVFPAGENYIGTAVNEHLQIMEVTKSAQQVEQVP